MNIIQQITTAPLQKQSLILPDGTSVTLTLYFVPMQLGWFIQTLTYGAFTLTNLRISNSPNMLHQFRNQIPFGLACFSTANREPSLIEDFSSGNSVLYLLTAAEVGEYNEYLAAGSP